MDQVLALLRQHVVAGDQAAVEDSVRAAVRANLPPGLVLAEGLIEAMAEVGHRYEHGEFYVPEMLVAARAMQAGLAILRPYLIASDVPAVGKVVIGTVKGDLHDIGKNLVGMMLEGAGYDIVDLGTDIAPERFAAAVREHAPQVVAMSALLTTTMQNMRASIEALEDLGVRGSVQVVVGGAPVTMAFADEIGADGYAPDASRAVRLIDSLLQAEQGGESQEWKSVR